MRTTLPSNLIRFMLVESSLNQGASVRSPVSPLKIVYNSEPSVCCFFSHVVVPQTPVSSTSLSLFVSSLVSFSDLSSFSSTPDAGCSFEVSEFSSPSFFLFSSDSVTVDSTVFSSDSFSIVSSLEVSFLFPSFSSILLVVVGFSSLTEATSASFFSTDSSKDALVVSIVSG